MSFRPLEASTHTAVPSRSRVVRIARPGGVAGRVFVASTLALIMLHLGQSFLGIRTPGLIFGLVGGAALSLGLLLGAKLIPRLFATAFLLAGTAILLTQQVAVASALPTLAEFRNLVAIIVLVPIVGLIFEVRRYGDSLLALAGRWTATEVRLTSAISVLAALVGAMASLASLVVVYETLRTQAREHERWQRLLTNATLRGYTASFTWAPSSSAVAVALNFTNASIADYLPKGLGLAGLILLLQAGFSVWERREPTWQPTLRPVERRVAVRESLEFLSLLLLLLGAVVAVGEITRRPLVDVVPIVCLAFAVGFFVLSGRSVHLVHRLAHYLTKDIPNKASEVALILSAGVLVGSLRLTGLSQQLAAGFQSVLGPNPAALVVALPVVMIVLGLLGVPPMVTLLLYTGTLDPAMIAVAPGVFTLALSFGVAVAMMVSPYTVPTFLLSAVTGRSSVQIGLQWNWAFGLASFVVALIYLLLLLPLPG
ncbi:MAG: hypothetical protein HY329_02980 [Chloroflexi bacterium]|nr:hypothetical protein [Chloroflexota bacterium]